MTLVNSIDKIVSWLTENVCSKITLKLPDDYRNDTGYDVVMVHPAAFPLYVPGKDRLPPNVAAPIPSVCVQLMEGSASSYRKRGSSRSGSASPAGTPANTAGRFSTLAKTRRQPAATPTTSIPEKLPKHTRGIWTAGATATIWPTSCSARLKLRNISQAIGS